MWIFSDDSGVHPASPRQLKMEVFPGDDVTTNEVADMISDLIRVGLVLEYEVTDESQVKVYWQVTGWKHQKIERPRRIYPLPECGTIRRCIDDTSTMYRSLTRPETTGDETRHITTTPKRVVGVREEYSKEFEDWWQHYPRRVQKGAASKAFRAALKRADLATIMESTVAFAKSPKGKGEFCPYPATWLNQDRWADDPAEWQDARQASNNGQSADDYKRDLERRVAKTKALIGGGR
jgi:hypothetical protein